MHNMIPIADHVQLRRDRRSGAVVDVDSAGYEQYLKIIDNNSKKELTAWKPE